LVLADMAAMWWLSDQSQPPVVLPMTPWLDFLAHAAEFALLSLLVLRACLVSPSPSWRGHAVHTAILVAAVYGLADEMHQAMVPGRACEWIDWMADITGAVTVQMVWLASD